MKREHRYVVFKIKDAQKYLSLDKNKELISLLMEIDSGRLNDRRKLHNYVVVADTWPEYETVWKMIEERVDSESTIHG